MTDSVDGLAEGNVYEDAMFGNELEIKYCNEKVVLVQDLESEQHHLYPRKQFEQASERSLMQTENRFKLQNAKK